MKTCFISVSKEGARLRRSTMKQITTMASRVLSSLGLHASMARKLRVGLECDLY